MKKIYDMAESSLLCLLNKRGTMSVKFMDVDKIIYGCIILLIISLTTECHPKYYYRLTIINETEQDIKSFIKLKSSDYYEDIINPTKSRSMRIPSFSNKKKLSELCEYLIIKDANSELILEFKGEDLNSDEFIKEHGKETIKYTLIVN